MVCRSELPLPKEQRKKIALFTNVTEAAVISAHDAQDIYEIPLILREQGLDDIIVKKLNLNVSKPNLRDWESVLRAKDNSNGKVRIAMVGKYVDFRDSYISLSEALRHAGFKTQTHIQIEYVESEEIQRQGAKPLLESMDAILIPGGFGDRGIEGMIDSIEFARINNKPYLGICLGLQAAVIEYARNKLHLTDANSTEFNPGTRAPVIALIKEWMNTDGSVENRSESSDLGGSMRLGAQECILSDQSMAKNIYQKNSIFERHRHRYEFNINFKNDLEEAGLKFSGHSKDGLVEIIELEDHPWFFACQFHPEFTSSPRNGHPLFESFVEASKKI